MTKLAAGRDYRKAGAYVSTAQAYALAPAALSIGYGQGKRNAFAQLGAQIEAERIAQRLDAGVDGIQAVKLARRRVMENDRAARVASRIKKTLRQG